MSTQTRRQPLTQTTKPATVTLESSTLLNGSRVCKEPSQQVELGRGTGIVALCLWSASQSNGTVTYSRFEALTGPLPPTQTFVGPNGERILLFAVPDDMATAPSFRNLWRLDRVELRGDGEQLYLPPAWGQWVQGRGPSDVALAPLPGAIRDAVSPRICMRPLVPLGSLYGRERLLLDFEQELVAIDRLPGWPTQPNGGESGPSVLGPVKRQQAEVSADLSRPSIYAGHGLGKHLSRKLGWGLRPGAMLGLGAAHAGAGKTAFLHQLADGLALRSAEIVSGDIAFGNVLTPVFLLSELPEGDLVWRSMSRWTGAPSSWFFGGRTALGHAGKEQKREIEAARDFASRLLDTEDSEYGQFAHTISKWVHVLNSRSDLGRQLLDAASRSSEAFIGYLKYWVDYVSMELNAMYPNRAVFPVVVIDPIQRFAEMSGGGEVESLNKLSSLLRTATISGDYPWITLLTSDTNKESSTGRVRNRNMRSEGTAAFRGSYNLLHEVSIALFMRKAPGSEWSLDEDGHGRHIEIGVVKNRYGGSPSGTVNDPHPRFEYHARCGRFLPYSRESAQFLRGKDEEYLENGGDQKSSRSANAGGGTTPEGNSIPDPGVEVN